MTVYQVLFHNNLDYRGLDTKFNKVIKFLQDGNFKSAEVKKLKHTGYLRAKLDITNRLLFKPIKHKNQCYLLVLEVIRNHHYSKSRFLRGEKLIEEDIVFNPVEVDNTESINIPSNNKPVHLLNKFIVFDEQQTDVLQCELPLIVIGSAGSGKTSVTLEKLKELEGKILYISCAPGMVRR